MGNRPTGLQPEFAVADLLRATISPEKLGRAILGINPDGSPAALDPNTQILAAILKSQAKGNCRFTPGSFNFLAWNRQLLFTENPNREYLLIQNVGSGDLMVVFEDGPANVEDDSSAQGQVLLTGLQTRAIRIVAGGAFSPAVAPRNSITLFTLSAATNGVAIEGA